MLGVFQTTLLMLGDDSYQNHIGIELQGSWKSPFLTWLRPPEPSLFLAQQAVGMGLSLHIRGSLPKYKQKNQQLSV